MKICCLVRNSVTKDARVLKEANSLCENGHEVEIVGLQDIKEIDPIDFTEYGVKITRLPWRSEVYRDLSRISVILGCCVVGILVLAPFLIVVPGIFYKLVAIFGIAWFSIIYLPNGLKRISARYKKQENIHQEQADHTLPSDKISVRIRPLISLAMRVYAVYACQKPMRRYLMSKQYDVVHCHDIGTLPLGVNIKKKKKVHLVYDAHEYYEGTTGLPSVLRWVYKFIHWRCSRSIDRFVVVNYSIGQLYIKQYPGLPSPDVIMNASKLNNQDEYDGRLHKAAGVPKTHRIVFFQGGFTNNRGLFQLLRSAEYYPASIHLVLMGWGHLESKLRDLADDINRSVGGTARIVFLPPVPNSELYFWTKGAAVGPILYEDAGINHKYCTPNKLWEYPTAGVPVIITPRIEMVKMIEKYDYGLIVDEPLEPRSIALKIEELIADHDKYKRGCEELAIKDNWNIYASRLTQIYTELNE